MTRYSLYLFILINLLFSSQIDSINYQLTKYGINEWESIGDSEELNELLTNILKDKLSPYLHPDNFLITIEMERTDITIYDSNYVEVTYPNIMKFNEKADINNQPCHFTVNMIPPNVKNLVINYSYKPTISLLVNQSIINKKLETNVSELILEIMNQQYPLSDFLMCNDIINIKSVNINELKSQEENNQVSLNRDDIYDDSWAVIIGIDKYKYSDQLNYAVKDAEAVKEMLINKFYYPEENIRYLTDEEATLSNIKLNLGEVATSAREDDRVLVFYSGHGETLKGADGSETGYIIPYEGRQDNPYATGLVMDEILRTCQISKSKHMLFLMDACYSGLMTENVKGLSKPQEEGYLSKVANEKARQIITAGGGDEQVIERDEWQHSAFTKNLLEGLDTWEADTDSDGYITADELGTYLRKSVTEDSDFQQTPQKGRFRNSGGGEFVFFSEIKASTTIEESSLNKLIQLIGEEAVKELLLEEMKSKMAQVYY